MVKAIREAVGTGRHPVRHARPVHGVGRAAHGRAIEPYDPLWFEEPVPPDMPEVMAEVARGTRSRSRPASG
jgi:galactonate dehydratase